MYMEECCWGVLCRSAAGDFPARCVNQQCMPDIGGVCQAGGGGQTLCLRSLGGDRSSRSDSYLCMVVVVGLSSLVLELCM